MVRITVKTCCYVINANDKSWEYEKLFFSFSVIKIQHMESCIEESLSRPFDLI